MATTIVNVSKDVCDVYIGRDCMGWVGSKFANPYHIRPGVDRQEALNRYTYWLRGEIKAGRVTVKELAALDGKRLGCWCKPKDCHGDVLAVFIAEAVKMVSEPMCKQEAEDE